MFTAQLEHIFTKEHFSEAFGEISKNASGLDEMRYSEFQAEFGKNIEELVHAILSGTYAPEPLKKIEIDKEFSDKSYAILYGKVQHSLVHAGLSLNISFLHTLDEKKPTLTFDMIEEFRTFVVDRTVISMLNKDEPIKLGNDGMLTKASRQLIAKNIKEKLGSYTMWKKESRKIENIIQTQCFNLAHAINQEGAKYKAFIGKF